MMVVPNQSVQNMGVHATYHISMCYQLIDVSSGL